MKLPGTIGEGRSGQFFVLCNKNDSNTPVDSSDSRHYNRSMAKFVEEQERKSMDHSHHDRTYKKSRFQQELEQSVSRKLISSLLLGCLLFCIAIAAVNALNQNARREDHLESVATTFHEVYNNTSAFLLDAGHTELFLSELRNDQDNLRYLISHYNVSALVEIQLILTDSKEMFGSQPFGGRDESPSAGI